jgi:sortase A
VKLTRQLDKVFLFVGGILLAIFVLRVFRAFVLPRMATAKFESAQRAKTNDLLQLTSQVDVSLWSQERIGAWRRTLLSQVEAPIAIVRMPRLGIEVPVFEGTEETALNRGAGWISGTTRPGDEGSVGIAGHRDGFFRALKDVQIGDQIDLVTAKSNQRFAVDEIEIVSPEDTRVLGPRTLTSVTLVTCYPFYFVGSAPRRFIVHASVAAAEN